MIVVIVNHQLVYFEEQQKRDSGYPVDEEDSAQYPAGADDVQRAREWVYENISNSEHGHGDRDRVILFGHSSGGAHIAMNLYAQGKPKTLFVSSQYHRIYLTLTGDPGRRSSTNAVHPPVAGVIYLSVPFHFDGTRPIRRKILEKYYGSAEEEAWGVSQDPVSNTDLTDQTLQPRSPLSLLKNLPDGSPILDAMTVPHYIGTVKWEVQVLR